MSNEKPKNKPFQSRGRSGREGSSLKLIGAIAAIAGFVWALLVYVIWDAGTGLIAPLCLMAVGIPLFMMGRSVARSFASGRV